MIPVVAFCASFAAWFVLYNVNLVNAGIATGPLWGKRSD